MKPPPKQGDVPLRSYRQFVTDRAAEGGTDVAIAKELGITVPTLLTVAETAGVTLKRAMPPVFYELRDADKRRRRRRARRRA